MTIQQPAEPVDADSSKFLSGWRYRAGIWSLVITALGYLAFALWSGWGDVVQAVKKVGLVGIAIALALSLVNYGLRFIRWQMYLRAMDHPVSCWPSLKIYLAGFALTTTPGKAGEALRGVLLKRWGMPFAKSLAAFFSERLSDLLAVVFLAFFGLSVYPGALPLITFGTIAVLLVLTVLSNRRAMEAVACRLSGTSRTSTFLRHLVQILLQARRCYAPGLLFVSSSLSVAAWLSEAWAFQLVLHWMGLNVPFHFSVFVYAVSMLTGALSFLPGGLGSAEAVMGALLISIGIDAPSAVAATVLIRLTTLWFAVLIGVTVLAHLQSVRAARLLNQPVELDPRDRYSEAVQTPTSAKRRRK